nr:hypothetical protein [Tanacetum cinerariifolium]
MSRPEVIKVVREEAKKLRIDPKEAISTKHGEIFKKAQDAEHEVLKREHSKKVKRLTELNRRRSEEYMWIMTNKIKPEPITDVRIHPNTKPIVASEWIMLKIAKISQQPDNIYTRSEATKKSQNRKQFSSNKSTLKLRLSKNPIQGLFLPKDQSQIHQKSKTKVQGPIVPFSQSLPEGPKLPKAQSLIIK